MAKLTCKRCEYQWESTLEHPKTCPRCKSYYWMKPLKRIKES